MNDDSARVRKDRDSTKMWSAGLYLRLSRDDDKYESDSISSQRDILRDFVSKNPDIKVYDEYVDDGWSGTNFNRPNFERMEEDLRAKKINCIIVKDLSRFARNCIEIGKYLSILFPYLKTRLICLNDNVDSYLNPESLDNLSTKFKNLMNDEFCRDISGKVKSSLTIKRENGEFIGSFPSYGYRKSSFDRHKLAIDEEAAEIVRLIFQMFLSGSSIRGIVRHLNDGKVLPPALYKKEKYPKYNPAGVTESTAWNDRTVRRILTNQVYTGNLVQNVMKNISYRIQKCRPVDREEWIVKKNTHEPIVSSEDFQRVAELLARDTRESPKTQNLGILAGFIRCGDCKRAMSKKTTDGGRQLYHYYNCSTYMHRGKSLCTKHNIRAEKVEAAVLSFIQFNIRLALEIEPVLYAINQSPERAKKSERLQSLLQQYERDLAKNRQLKAELYPDYKAGIIEREEYDAFRQKYEIKTSEIEQNMESLNRKIEEIDHGISLENNFIKAFKNFHTVTELTREIVCALIENVFVFEDNRIEIEMKYKDEYETIVEYVFNNQKTLSTVSQIQLSLVRQFAGSPAAL